MKVRTLVTLLAIFGLLAAACGSDDEDSASGGGGCDPLPLHEEGVLTVATGETVFPPWMGAGEDDFDDPTTGTGYEGALVLRPRRGARLRPRGRDLRADAASTTVIAPGEKDWDFNIQQYSITAELATRSSTSPTATTRSSRPSSAPLGQPDRLPPRQRRRPEGAPSLGAAIGTTSLDYIDSVIEPDSEAAQCLRRQRGGQGGVRRRTRSTASSSTCRPPTSSPRSRSPTRSILGVLPDRGRPRRARHAVRGRQPAGVRCVNDALAALRDDGTLAAIEEEWLAGRAVTSRPCPTEAHVTALSLDRCHRPSETDLDRGGAAGRRSLELFR